MSRKDKRQIPKFEKVSVKLSYKFSFSSSSNDFATTYIYNKNNSVSRKMCRKL